MQRNNTLRLAGVSLSAAALGLLTEEGTAAAHEGTSTPDLRGRVASVGSGGFVLKKFDGTTETVDTTPTTTYSEPGSSVAPAGVTDGENVAVTLDPTVSSPTVTSVMVELERVGGRVTNVSGSTLTVATRHGSETVDVSPDTRYLEKGASPTGVGTGELITALGLPDPSTPAALDAQVVVIFSPPHLQTVPTPPRPQPQSGRGPAPAPWGRTSPNPGSSSSPGSSGGQGGQGFGGR